MAIKHVLKWTDLKLKLFNDDYLSYINRTFKEQLLIFYGTTTSVKPSFLYQTKLIPFSKKKKKLPPLDTILKLLLIFFYLRMKNDKCNNVKHTGIIMYFVQIIIQIIK